MGSAFPGFGSWIRPVESARGSGPWIRLVDSARGVGPWIRPAGASPFPQRNNAPNRDCRPDRGAKCPSRGRNAPEWTDRTRLGAELPSCRTSGQAPASPPEPQRKESAKPCSAGGFRRVLCVERKENAKGLMTRGLWPVSYASVEAHGRAGCELDLLDAHNAGPGPRHVTYTRTPHPTPQHPYPYPHLAPARHRAPGTGHRAPGDYADGAFLIQINRSPISVSRSSTSSIVSCTNGTSARAVRRSQ